MSDLSFRHATAQDILAIVALNAAVAEVTSEMSPARCAELLAVCQCCYLAEAEGTPMGFALIMYAGAAYENDNFNWFSARLKRFAYVDRIVVDAAARGRGLGARLYERVALDARAAGCLTLAAEIDSDPPNTGSLAFHAAQGFAQLGTRRYASGKVVSMQIKGLTG